MRLIISGVLSVLIVAVGVGVAYPYVQAFMAELAKQEESPAPMPTNVAVEVLRPTTVEDELLLTGRVAPWEEVLISAEVRGLIEWEGVDEGDPVSAGQELARIDTTALLVAHEQAVARHALAAQELARNEDLRAQGIGTGQAYDKAVADFSVTDADVRASRIQLEKSVVLAPFDAVVNTVSKEAGEFVDSGAALLHLVQVDRVKAMVAVPEQDILRFSVGDPVGLTLEALDGDGRAGVIHRIATTADPLTRTFRVEVAVDNADGLLKPGMTVRARLLRGRFEDAIAAPLFAVMAVENQHFVVVEEAGTARLRQVKLGRTQGDRVHVTEGLAAGERLIVTGQRDLRDGDAVNVTGVNEG